MTSLRQGYSERVREQAAWQASDQIAGDTPFRLRSGQALPLQEMSNSDKSRAGVKVSSMYQERLMMSAIQPSVAALEAGLMEQE